MRKDKNNQYSSDEEDDFNEEESAVKKVNLFQAPVIKPIKVSKEDDLNLNHNQKKKNKDNEDAGKEEDEDKLRDTLKKQGSYIKLSQ